ncbi:TetR/AcrR family transcriptional regulator [Nocardia sp. NPDC004654]|uniref:TetR/AcrR family transcriptional regulator n=2 Tax=unclassified Nocardia TaxID=2637762 RepID=UPI0033B5EDD9
MPKNTRAAMIHSAVEVLRERGVGGVTIDAILARSGSPRGSVYHHFPGGRAQLITEALEFAGDAIGAIIEGAAAEGSTAILHEFVRFWRQMLLDSDFTAGCPVVAVAVGSNDEAPELFDSTAGIFQRWWDALHRAFLGEGLAEDDAGQLATMAIASVEGAVVLCRSRRGPQPLDDVAHQLELLIDSQRFLSRARRSTSTERS